MIIATKPSVFHHKMTSKNTKNVTKKVLKYLDN
jgi:hypothetical protein